jgi:hypothetical protein
MAATGKDGPYMGQNLARQGRGAADLFPFAGAAHSEGRQSAKGHIMVQRLHLVFGGELVDPTRNKFRTVDDIHVVGIFPTYDAAYAAWKAEAQRTVDNAHMRYFIAHLHRLTDEAAAASRTEEIGI